MKKTIVIIFGGNSSEYSVSLESAYSVLSHINKDKYDIYMIGITKYGQWYHFDGDILEVAHDTWWKKDLNQVMISPDPTKHSLIEMSNKNYKSIYVDAIFPILHGTNGEDGTIQGLIELSKIPIIGCSSASSALCMDKDCAHKLVEHSGVRVPQSLVLTSKQEIEKRKKEINKLKFPLYIKPMKAGSSHGISRVIEFEEVYLAAKLAFEYDNEIIIEEEIPGFEVGCAIIGIDDLTTGRIDEIELTQGFFDFTEKYTLETSNIHMPARIDPSLEEKLQETAKHIYKVLGCQVFARVDMFLTPDNEIVFNEVNTIPGFTHHSRFPQMLKGIGLEFKEILEILIEMGLNHENNHAA